MNNFFFVHLIAKEIYHFSLDLADLKSFWIFWREGKVRFFRNWFPYCSFDRSIYVHTCISYFQRKLKVLSTYYLLSLLLFYIFIFWPPLVILLLLLILLQVPFFVCCNWCGTITALCMLIILTSLIRCNHHFLLVYFFFVIYVWMYVFTIKMLF